MLPTDTQQSSRRKPQGLEAAISLIDILPAAGIALNASSQYRFLSLSFLTLWLGLRCTIRILQSGNKRLTPKSLLPQILLTSLFFLSARTLIREDDNAGAVVYIVIATAFLVGSELGAQRGARLLQLLSIGTLLLSGGILANAIIHFAVPLTSPWQAGWLTLYNNESLQLPFGRINSFGAILALLSTLSFYAARSTSLPMLRIVHALGALMTFILCLATESRTAAGTPILAILIAWGLVQAPRLIQQGRGWLKPALRYGLPALVVTTFWQVAIQPDIASGLKSELDSSFGRFSQWTCWINNSILDGNNKILFGQGFDLSKFIDSCDNNIAESGLIQIVSQHGLLGLITLTILSINTITAVNRQQKSNWKEMCVGTSLVIVMSNLTTPVYLGSYWNAALSGLILGFAFIEPEDPARQRQT